VAAGGTGSGRLVGMDGRLSRSVLARDGALGRIGSVTRWIAAASVAGALVLMAGFAHLLPTHLLHVAVNRDGSGSSGLSGPQSGPGGGSGSGQVTSGGS
jgi:hypothetical protein